MLKKFNLRTRMIFSICFVVFLAFIITISFVAIKSRNMATTEGFDKAKEIAHRYGGVVKAEIEIAMDAARTLAQAFEGIKNSGTVPDRKVFDEMLKQILERNPGFIGVWTCWEPNALDGKDKEFVKTLGHDSSGRYVPYWNRGAGNIAVEPLLDYEQDGAGDYYLLTKRSGNESILDPYIYSIGGKDTLITSVVAPIEENGTVVGVAGIDIALATFYDLVTKISVYDTGYISIISNNSAYVAHPKADRIGQDILKTDEWATSFTGAIKSGAGFTTENYSKTAGGLVSRICVPIQIGQTKTPWAVLINVPKNKILENAQSIMYMAIFIGIVSLLVLIVVIFFIAKGIADPLNMIIEGMNEGASQVASASNQVSSASQGLAEGASEQAASIEETSSSLEEMSSMTKQNAGNAGQADNLMKKTNRVVTKANDSMIELTASMNDISKASEETSKIIKTIDEIAFQTNLLALNAAVEAARAGEAGAGFAVVADEVRNLAMRAADAAKNTSELIEGTVKRINDGSQVVNTTNQAFNEVAESSQKIGELVGEISAASNEQAEGIEQINKAVVEMDKVTQQNAANAEESASASEEMNAQANQMMHYVQELVKLVSGEDHGGRTIGRASCASGDVREHHLNVPTVQTTPQKRELTFHRAKEVRPDQVIPMDNDFKDF